MRCTANRRTKDDFAHQLPLLFDRRFPNPRLIRIVLESLNALTPGSLHKAFPRRRRGGF